MLWKGTATHNMHRSSQRRWSKKKVVLKNFAKFKGKHLCQSIFFNKVAGLMLWHRCFPVNFAKRLRIPMVAVVRILMVEYLLIAGWRTTYKLNCRNLLLLICLVASSFYFFNLQFFFIHICFGFDETKLTNEKFYGELRPVLKYNFK